MEARRDERQDAAPTMEEMNARVDQRFRELEEKLTAFSEEERARVREAFRYGRAYHEGQLRKDGSPYITHPLEVAHLVAELGLDADSVMAALLHDTIEDTEATHEEVAHRFGATVADLVEGVTKLTRVKFSSTEEKQMENLRKMLMAMAKDIRVILIKICDRVHNIRTMEFQSEKKQREKALETLEIYAPIAHRLGMQRMKWEMEDQSLKFLDPIAYKEIDDELQAQAQAHAAFMDSIQEQITARLEKEGIRGTVYGRVKHVYSIYRKMFAQNKHIGEIFDLYAFRVIVDSLPDCYNVLGVIHDMFKPVPGRFKDYISTPKPNMYQSLHTTVIGTEGIPFEVQIRTWEMHHTAEYGIAAHWKYKMDGSSSVVRDGDEEKFAWVRRLLEDQQESDAQDFFHDLKIDMFADEVFVFSPKGDVINLPAGATPIDFAYSIHSDVGNHMVGAKVNGRIVTFDYVLQNGDIVEIRTSKSSPGPSRDWLNIVKSGSARTKIKQWYKKERREENVLRGLEMLEDELKRNELSLEDVQGEEIMTPVLKRLSYATPEDMYAAIGYGGVTAARVANRLRDEQKSAMAEKKSVLDRVSAAAERREERAKKEGKAVHGILVEGLDNCLVKFSRCCTPVPGDEIIGFITRGQGVSIHRKDCENYLRRTRDQVDAGRWIHVSWASQITDSYVTILTIAAKDRSGLVMDIATVLNSLNAKVRNLSARDNAGLALVNISLEVRSTAELRQIMNRLASVPSVTEVSRSGK